MAWHEVYTQLGTLFITLLAGYILGKIKLLTPAATEVFSKYVLKVALPALLISSLVIPYSVEKLHTALLILLLAVPCYGLAYLVGLLTARILTKDIRTRAIYCFGLVFSNAGFIGFPVFQALYGKEALFFAAIYNIAFNLLLYTLGIKIMNMGQKQSGLKPKTDLKMLFNPGVVASMIGLFFFVTAIPLPQFLIGAVDSIGNTCVPLSMLTIGAILSELPIARMFNNLSIYFLAVVRLVLLPLLIFIVLKVIFRLEDMWLIAIPVITAGMPVGTNAGLMAREYNNDAPLASQTILITTIFCCFTITLLALWLQSRF